MCVCASSLAEATFTILPNPLTGQAVFLRDGVIIQEFATLAEAFAFGSCYVTHGVATKSPSELLEAANRWVK